MMMGTVSTRMNEKTLADVWRPGPGLVDFLLLVPGLVLVVLGIPLVLIVASSFEPNVLLEFQGPALTNYVYLATRGYYVAIVVRAVSESCLTTLIAVPLGYIAPLGLRNLQGRLGNLAIMGLTFPILTGPLVEVLGWMALLPNRGPIFGLLIAPPRLLGTQTAVVISLVQFTLPFTILTMFTDVRQIPPVLYEAAKSLGAGPSRTFTRITLPLSLPGLLSRTVQTSSPLASEQKSIVG